MENNASAALRQTNPEICAAEPIGRRDKWLLAGALLIGVTFAWMWPASIGAWSYGLFWLVALGVYLLFFGGALLKNRYAMLLLGGTLAILVRYFFGWEDGFDTFHIFLLPALLMFVLVFVKESPAPQREGVLLSAYAAAWVIAPFSAIGRAFSVAASLGGGKKQVVPVLLGILFGVPITCAVAALLMTADAGMESVMRNLLGGLRFGSAMGFFLRMAVVTLLFYSVYANAWKSKPCIVREREANWSPITLGIVTGMLLLIYAIYLTVQFQYFFGGQLPAGTTYSAYAREGFAQLIAVSCINFLLFGLAGRYARRTVAGTVLQTLLLVSTALILSSALVRLLLYIGAYGLTMKRVLSLWAIVYLAVLTLLSAVRLCRMQMPLLRISAAVLLYWYAALTLVPWDMVIGIYNQSRFGLVG